MSLTRSQFQVLEALVQTSQPRTRAELAELAGLAGDELEATLAGLVAEGLADGCLITGAGVQALEPYRVRNALIMAAGLSSRFVPLSYDVPKALVRVHGEPLVERQIKQLLEKGISEIYLTVGYRKELYTYLAAKYGVHLIDNPDYLRMNTFSSVYHARGHLGNSYILCGDLYYEQNPFRSYQYESVYLAQYQSGPVDEWGFELDAEGHVKGWVEEPREDDVFGLWCDYLTSECFDALRDRLEEYYETPALHDSFWQAVWSDLALYSGDEAARTGALRMGVQLLPEGCGHEFDCMDDLYAFDPTYLAENVSPSLDAICGVLGCERSDIRAGHALEGGSTNFTCAFTVRGERYVFRKAGGYNHVVPPISRAQEARVEQAVSEQGIDPTFIYEDPAEGWKVSRYIEGARELDPLDDAEVAEAFDLLHRFHRAAPPAEGSERYDWLVDSQLMEGQIAAFGRSLNPRSLALKPRCTALALLLAQDRFGSGFCHNSPWWPNFVYDARGRLHLIDWEYAAVSDEASDFAMFAETWASNVERGEGSVWRSKDDVRALLALYLGREPSDEQFWHYFGMALVVNWWMIVWCDLAEMVIDDYFGPALDWQERYIDEALEACGRYAR